MSYVLGQDVLFVDADHGSASTGEVTIIKPDGTTTSETGSLASSWTASHTPAVVGLHTYYWTFTGTGAGITKPDVFDVRPLTMSCPVSLADLRNHMNWPSTKDTSDDADLLMKGSEATSVIESELGRPILKRTYTLTFEYGVTDAVLPNVPCHCDSCSSVAVLTIDDVSDSSLTVTVTPAGVLSGLTADAVVTYTAGYSSMPPWADLAIKRMTEHLWGRISAPRHTRDARGTAEGEPGPLSYLLPYSVQSLIGPHELKGG